MATAKKYELTNEDRAQFGPWRDKWIANAMRTAPMTETERERARDAVVGLYEAAKLEPPPRERIVFVPSPIVGQVAAGFAAWIWAQRKDSKAATGDATRAATRAATGDATWTATWDATRAATWAATRAATGDATWDATWAATGAATRAATRAATGAATWAATGAATGDATGDATRAATWAATGDATGDATGKPNSSWFSNITETIQKLAGEIFGASGAHAGVQCAHSASWMLNGGNQWASYPAFLSFFRHVSKLPLDYSKWEHYETLAELTGPRWMHTDFCIISDFPEVLTVDEGNRPHNNDGPFCRWRDGFSLYSVHGVRVPEWLFTHPQNLTVEAIHAEQSAEVRRIMVERFGLAKYVQAANFEVLHSDEAVVNVPDWVEMSKGTQKFLGTHQELHERRLLRRDNLLIVELKNTTLDADKTRRVYHVPCHPELRPLHIDGRLGNPQTMTCQNAVASTYGMTGAEYKLQAET